MNHITDNTYTHFITRHKFWILTLVVLILLGVNFGRIYLHYHDGPPKEFIEHSFSGVVTEKNPTSLVVKDKPGTTKTFEVMPDTKILRGGDILSIQDLQVGNFVIVRVDGTPLPDGKIKALIIQIFK